MASPTGSLSKSRFLHSYLPEDNDELKYMVCHAGATLICIVLCGTAVAVYYVLEAFLRPLMWACLVGTVLYPVKYSLTNIARSWLRQQAKANRTLAVGVILLPLQVIESTTDHVVTLIQRHVKVILMTFLGIPAVHFLYYFGPLHKAITIVETIATHLYNILEYFSNYWIWSLVAGYVILVVFWRTPKSKIVLSWMSVPVWITLCFHITSSISLLGTLRVPICIILLVVMAIGLSTEYTEAKKLRERQGDTTPLEAGWDTVKYIFSGQNSAETENSSPNKSLEDDSLSSEGTSEEAISPIVESDKVPELSAADKSQAQDESRCHQEEDEGEASHSTERRRLSDQCFMSLCWTFALVQLWIHVWVIQLLPIFLLVWLAKSLVKSLNESKSLKMRLGLKAGQTFSVCKQQWLQERKDILVPPPIQGLVKLVLRADRKVIHILQANIDKLMTVFIILMAIVAVSLVVMVSIVQVHQESVQIVKMSSNLLNKTIHPDLKNATWLPKSEEMKNALDTMVANAYIYGRSYIASKVKHMLADEIENKSHIERQVLELWDRLYENYFVTNASEASVRQTKQLTRRLTATNLTQMWQDLDMFQARHVMSFLQENVETFKSVLESIWIVLKGNINMLFSITWAVLSLILGGGTALFNFVIYLVIFVTTLFYLIALSGDVYKPVEWIVSMIPGATHSHSHGHSHSHSHSHGPDNGSGRLGEAVEEAISGVFIASFKMATFYGIYTWLVCTVFGLNIVFLPSAIGSLFAAIPFVGTYWACIPGTIELLVNGEVFLVALFVACHMVPTYFVDTAIYSDIKGGGHPYLTGLAIAGGIYCFGLEGAIIGPVLLCCLIVAMKFFQGMMQFDTQSDQGRLLVMGKGIKRNIGVNRTLSLS